MKKVPLFWAVKESRAKVAAGEGGCSSPHQSMQMHCASPTHIQQNRRSGGRHKWRSRVRLKSQSDTASKETWELLNALFNQELINRLGENISGMGGNAHRKKHKERKSIQFC